MQTISILGTGWLGLPLVDHFSQLGHRVYASTTTAERLPELQRAGATPFIISLDSFDEEVLLEFLQADILIVNIPYKNIERFQGFVDVIKQSSIKRILFVSSTSVYANVPQVVTENDKDCYSNSPLLKIEDIFSEIDQERVTHLRLSGLIGYQRHPGRFFKAGKKVPNPDTPVNLIHRDDCIGIIDAIIANEAWGELFNASADSHPSKRAFYSYARQLLDRPAPPFGDTSPDVGKIVSSEKIKQVLQYTFKHPDVMRLTFTEGNDRQ